MAFKNWRFRSVLAIVVSIVATLPVLIFGGIELYRKANQVKASHDDQLRFLLSRLEIEAKNNFEKFIFSADSAGKIILEIENENAGRVVDKILTSYLGNHGIDIFSILNSEGNTHKIFKSSEYNNFAKDPNFMVKVKTVIQSREPYVGVFSGSSEGPRSPAFIHPLISMKGELKGILVGQFKLGFLQNILGDQETWSNHINYFLISDEGYSIVSKTSKMYGDIQPVLNFFGKLNPDSRDIVEGEIEGETIRGMVVRASSKMNWKFVIFYSDREVRSDYLLMWLSFISTIVFALSFGVVISIAISRRIAKPILDTVKLMRSLKAKNFGKVIETDVDVYSKELQELINAIKEMSYEISQYTLNLEETVEKRTISLRVMTEELQKKNFQLQEANQLKNQFLAMAAHDLRNPIGVIRGYADFLAEEVPDTKNIGSKEMLEKCRSLCDFMIEMLNELLDISQIESGKVNLKITDVDCNKLVESVVNMHRAYAQKKKIEIVFHSDQDIPLISLDSRRMEQALDNLISNAIKYSFEGTRVNVELTVGSRELIISVKDQGQGIKESELSKLFKPFSRASSLATGGERSTGLGLAIVAKIVQEHKGRVWVESSWGSGSSFFIALPFAQDQKKVA